MPSVREVMLNRAKEPAKVHSMERVSAAPSPANSAAAAAAAAAAGAAEHPAAQGSACPTPTAGTPAAARPPRPRAAPGSGGSGAPAARVQEGRRPAACRAPSEPPGGGSGPPARAQGPGPQAKARASSASRAQAKLGGTPPPVERKDVGKVPAYLKKRQEEMAEAKRLAERPVSPQPPAGYRKVDEAEKHASLEVLRQRKVEVEKAQRNLPFKIETVGQKQRESDLANRMGHIDKLIGMFSQPRVFIPMDAEPIAVSVPPLAGHNGPAVQQEDDAASGCAQRGRNGSGMREAMQRPSSREETQGRQPSRESRAAADAQRRRQNGILQPWEQDSPGYSSPMKTGVQVAAPPGGKSSLSFDWQ